MSRAATSPASPSADVTPGRARDLGNRQLDRIPVPVGPWIRYPRAQGFASSRLCMRAHSGHSVWRTSQMAKALYGHVGGPDPRMVSEMRRLQQRVRDLEAELARLHEENDVLAAEADHDLLIPVREPALT